MAKVEPVPAKVEPKAEAAKADVVAAQPEAAKTAEPLKAEPPVAAPAKVEPVAAKAAAPEVKAAAPPATVKAEPVQVVPAAEETHPVGGTFVLKRNNRAYTLLAKPTKVGNKLVALVTDGKLEFELELDNE